MTAAQYAYDALGRRIGKYDAAAMETTFYYYNDQWQILAAYDEYSSLQRYYVYGNTIDEVLLSVIPAQAGIQDTYYAHDHLYSPAALLDDTGAVVERYEYDACGKVAILAPNYELRSTHYKYSDSLPLPKRLFRDMAGSKNRPFATEDIVHLCRM